MKEITGVVLSACFPLTEEFSVKTGVEVKGRCLSDPKGLNKELTRNSPLLGEVVERCRGLGHECIVWQVSNTTLAAIV